jgi:hypothetical protein
MTIRRRTCPARAIQATAPRFVRELLHVFVAALVTFRRGKDEGVATLTASADSSIFLRVSVELALPIGRNRHLVNSLTRVLALSLPDV